MAGVVETNEFETPRSPLRSTAAPPDTSMSPTTCRASGPLCTSDVPFRELVALVKLAATAPAWLVMPAALNASAQGRHSGALSDGPPVTSGAAAGVDSGWQGVLVVLLQRVTAGSPVANLPISLTTLSVRDSGANRSAGSAVQNTCTCLSSVSVSISAGRLASDSLLAVLGVHPQASS